MQKCAPGRFDETSNGAQEPRHGPGGEIHDQDFVNAVLEVEAELLERLVVSGTDLNDEGSRWQPDP